MGKAKEKENGRYFLRSLKYLKPYKGLLSITIICCVMTAILYSFVPYFTEKTITAFTSGDAKMLLYYALMLLVFKLGHSVVFYFLWGNFAFKLKAKVTKDIRFNTVFNTLNLKVRNFDLNSSGQLLQIVSADTSSLANIYNLIIDMFMSMVTKLAILVYIFIANYILGFYCILEFVLVCATYNLRIKARMKDQRELKISEDKNIGLVNETIRGVRDIKNYNIQDSIMEKNDRALCELEKLDFKFGSKQYKLYRITEITKHIMAFLYIPLALLLIHFNLTTFAIAFTIFIFRQDIVSIVDWFMSSWEKVKDGELFAERIFKVIDGWEEGFENFPAKDKFKKLPKKPDIEIKDLTFSYDNHKNILKNFSIKIESGKKIAIIGASGEGKSTVLKLLNKSYEVENSKIFIGGNDINDFSRETLRNTITIVPQDPYIFNFSVYDNLRIFNPKASKKQIESACKKAQIYDYIMQLPDKFDTLLGENGTKLSGGQKQRLAIARAFLKNSPIFIFDETTSALDNENQSKIKEVIDGITREKIVIIVAHRLSTIVDADEIFLMKDGRIVTSGKHRELLKSCREYKSLYEKESTLANLE